MQNASDSFVTFLKGQLQDELAVHFLRASAAEPDTALLKHNACNVKVLGVYQDGSLENALLSVDILGSEERQVMAWCRQVKKLLMNSTAPEFDFSGSVPQHTGRNISWDKEDLNWQVVRSAQNYCHWNLTLVVSHHDDTLYTH